MIDSSTIRDQVRDAYSAAATDPVAKHPFPVGRAFAESLGYPAELLDSLPATAVDTFAGVSNVALFAEMPPGSAVLDLGCGAGLDSLVAARRIGPAGKVWGIDFSEPMLDRARRSAGEAGVGNAQFLAASAERLPLPDGSVDVAIVNGIFNLNPGRATIFRELARVVRRGGAVFGAELILVQPLSADQICPSSWFA